MSFVEILMYENFDLDNLISSINIKNLERLLEETNYDRNKSKRLIEQFENGFPLGYERPRDVQ